MLKKIHTLIMVAALFLTGTTVLTMTACKSDTVSGPEEATAHISTDAAVTTDETTTEEKTTMSIKDQLNLNINISDLDALMKPIFSGTESINETVMFIDNGDVKSLLYPIETVISVTSYDGTKIYEEGKDYEITDGKLKVTENSSIPCITSAVYYNDPDSLLQTRHDGELVMTHWGEGQLMTDWQVNVRYTHAEGWSGYAQPSELEVYQTFIGKLQNGEDVTVFFCGDSITYGANASWIVGCAPYQLSYPILFTQALADLFDYTVHYEAANLTAPNNGANTSNVPTEDYVAGTRGTITYINTAIGGWKSSDGVAYFDTFIKEKAEAYGCDLFIIAFGMNDGFAPADTKNNIQKVVDGVLKLNSEANIVLLSTMVPNPNATNGWYGNQDKQQSQLVNLAKTYRLRGYACGTCRMTSVSLSVLERKDFNDYSGNNINHPNDYFSRVYAQTLLQDVIGYENMN